MKKLIAFLILCSQFTFAMPDNYHEVAPHLLYRSGRPSFEDFKELAGQGIRTVINMEKGQDQEAEWAAQLGLQYFHIPVGALNCPSMAKIDEALNLIVQNLQRADSRALPLWKRSDRDRLGGVSYSLPTLVKGRRDQGDAKPGPFSASLPLR